MQSLYFHFPFCERKCFYCDFYSVESLDLINKFIESLIKEIELRASNLSAKPEISTIFFGGGTPSLIKSEQFGRIFEALFKNFNIVKSAEITIEANPGTISLEPLNNYKRIGINRLSIGVQSFVPEELKFLQRIHDADEAEKAILLAREAGFDNLSIDLIFAIPGQTIESLGYTIDKTLKFELEHISAYSLIYEPNTPLYYSWKKGKINKIGDELDAELYEYLIKRFTDAGYEQYEVSNFTKPGKKCQHNINYWHGGEYFAFGPSAHGYLNVIRYWNYRNLTKYMDSISNNILPIEGSERLTKPDKITERILLGLRSDGINLTKFKEEFDLDLLQKIHSFLDSISKEDYFTISNNILRITSKGYLICDEIALRIAELVEDY